VEGLCFSLSGRDGKAESLRGGSGSGGEEFGKIWFLLFVWSFWFNLVSDLDLKMRSEISEFLYSAFRTLHSAIEIRLPAALTEQDGLDGF
jgi:hypothetical protein